MDLKLPAPDGLTDIVVAVDPFTRWMDIAPLPTRSSADVTMWFHNQVVCRYGTLIVVQSDQGNEFKGDFKAYLKAWGVQHRLCSIQNPRTNGLVERLDGTIKRGLKRFLSVMPRTYWWEFL